MRLQLASDLHLEFLAKRFPGDRLIAPAPDAELLVLAGDIHSGTHAVDMFADWPVPVIYVAGNHEFYGGRWESTRAAIREACAGTSVHFLDNDAFEFGGVRFLGCTLWTDFKLPGFTQREWMKDATNCLPDYRLIRTARGRLRAALTLEDHERSLRWLQGEFAKPYPGKTVVVTHMGPHPNSIHPRYAGSNINAGFVSDLTPLLSHANLWVHGHVHDSFDYDIGRCRVVANPAGYVLKGLAEATTSEDLLLENKQFEPRLVLEVDVPTKRVQRPGGLLEDGLASGPATPCTQAGWDELDAIARGDIV